jgi:tetratricopeptide (TPR) repeat protein
MIHNTRRVSATLGAVTLALLAGLPAASRPPGGGISALEAARAWRRAHPPMPATGTPTRDITQFPNGAGVVFSHPTVKNAPPAVARFGTGATRWLQLAVGGYPELGKTPTFTAAEAAMEDLELRSAARVAGAEPLARRLGVTHVAVSEISGTPQQCSLTLRLLGVPGKVAVGAPIELRGSEAEVVGRLPAASAECCARLGLRVSAPVAPVEKAADLEFLGRPWVEFEESVVNQNARLTGLASRSLLAAVMALGTVDALAIVQSMNNYADMAANRERVLKLGPHHPLAWAAVGDVSAASAHLLGDSQGRATNDARKVDEEVRRFPMNLPLNLAAALARYHYDNELQNAHQAAENAVRSNTRSPYAWRTLARTIGRRVYMLSAGRPVSSLREPNLQWVTALLPLGIEAARRSIELDPTYGEGWITLSSVAARAGQRALAESAFWKGLATAQGDITAYQWGARLYSADFYPDPKMVERLAQTTAADTTRSPRRRVRLIHFLFSLERDALAKKMARTREEKDIVAYHAGQRR